MTLVSYYLKQFSEDNPPDFSLMGTVQEVEIKHCLRSPDLSTPSDQTQIFESAAIEMKYLVHANQGYYSMLVTQVHPGYW